MIVYLLKWYPVTRPIAFYDIRRKTAHGRSSSVIPSGIFTQWPRQEMSKIDEYVPSLLVCQWLNCLVHVFERGLLTIVITQS
jgi:hypothetical protein